MANQQEFRGAGHYRIEVLGDLDPMWSERLGSMQIRQRRQDDEDLLTVLEGSVSDQAELAGILNTFYELHLSLVSVQRVKEADCGKEP